MSQYRSLFSTLTHYTRSNDLHRAKALHSHIIKTGSSSSCVFISNALINLYIKSSDLLSAHLVFESTPHKDVVSYNTLINAFSQQKGSSSSFVFDLFQRMRAENKNNTLSPDSHTFAGLLNAAASDLHDDVLGGRQIHCLVVKTVSLSCDVFVGSCLVDVYCKMGVVGDARKVFDEMSVRNSVSWATMISGYAVEGLGRRAFELFVLMCKSEEEEKGLVNEFVVTGVLSGLALPEFADTGKQVHCLAVKNGWMSFVAVGNALVTTYAKCGRLDDALRAFELCGGKNSVTWSAMISGFVQSGDSRKALNLFAEMHFAGIMPTEFVFGGVITACSDIGALESGKQVHSYVLKLGYGFQIYIMSALVDMYGKFGSVSDARKGFDCIKEPDVVLWTFMIGGCIQNGENEMALNLYCKMLKEGIFPNELSIASLLKACSTLCAVEQGKQIHAHTIKYGFSLEFPIISALFTMYAKCGSLEDGNLVFRNMPTKDIVSWNAMISGLAQNGKGTKALELFEEMRLSGTEPDHVTFVNLISACSHMGFVERGWIYFRMMSDEFGIVPGVEHYACMVDVLSRAGKLYEAKEFIESATIDHGMCLWRILLSACRNHRNYELGAYAGEKLMELGSLDSQAYVLLSSIYTSLGRRDDVEWVRRMMKLRGVSKKPGCSWIELKSEVHVFVVGDMMHPLIDTIGLEIRRLNKHMKDQPSPTTF